VASQWLTKGHSPQTCGRSALALGADQIDNTKALLYVYICVYEDVGIEF
jgi:hypothetical protein